jgi:hypothetical protein
MGENEDREKARKLRALFTGHPPKLPRDILKEAEAILHPTKRRKSRAGRDREEKGGFDREV